MIYFDMSLRLALNYTYVIFFAIDGVDSGISNLTYFYIYSFDEIIEMPISSDGSYINTRRTAFSELPRRTGRCHF